MSKNGSHASTLETSSASRNLEDQPVDGRFELDPRGTREAEPGHPAEPEPPKKERHWLRWLILGLLGLAAVGAGLYFAVPWAVEYFNTESTDDAFVASHVTNLAPRIADEVMAVLVEENERVKLGDLLIRLDPVPFDLAVAQAKADLDEAEADVEQTRAQVKGLLEEARASFFRFRNTREQVRRQVAELKANVAARALRESDLRLAQRDYRRLANLEARGSATQAELDERRNQLEVAEQAVTQAKAQIEQTRAALGLPTDVDDPLDLPSDIESEQSSIESARSAVASALSQVGLPFDLEEMSRGESFREITGLKTDADLEHAFNRIIDRAPQVKLAEARLEKARRQLDDARLQQSYTEIRSPIDGYVEERSVHPGDRVQPGQTLMTIRPYEVWIDANFKETQLDNLVIGQPVDLYVDAWPDRVLKGRVAGFSPATGAASSLLPPENATGNYVKVVQRLPVRIELVEPPPEDTPLMVGLSVVPKVRLDQAPFGRNAGQRLLRPGARMAPQGRELFEDYPPTEQTRIPPSSGEEAGR